MGAEQRLGVRRCSEPGVLTEGSSPAQLGVNSVLQQSLVDGAPCSATDPWGCFSPEAGAISVR